MSTYNIDDAEVLPSETFNNNNFSHINMNFAEVVKGASKYKHSETELDYNIDSPNDKEIRDGEYNPLKASTSEKMSKSILRMNTTISNSTDSPILANTAYQDSSVSSYLKRSSSDSGSLSKIPVPVSTIKRTGKKRSRKNSITKVAGANRLSECIFDAMMSAEAGEDSHDMSDGYIDKIILQSSKKSTDRGLDSSGDFLDDSEDVFEEDEKRKEACDNIVMKFLEMTGEKSKSNNLSPAMCVRLESRGTTPVLNLKTNFLKNEQVRHTRVSFDKGSLKSEEATSNKLIDESIVICENNLGVDKTTDEEKDCNLDLKYFGESEGLSNTNSNDMEMVMKGLENKLNLYGTKIETLENSLKIAKDSAEDKDMQCEELRREVKVLLSQPAQIIPDMEGKDSTQVEHLVKGFENKMSIYENKICTLEDQLKTAKVTVEDQDKACDDLARELKVTEVERLNLEVKAKELDDEVNIKRVKIFDVEEELRTFKSKFTQLELELDEESRKKEVCENKRLELELQVNVYEIETNSSKSKLEMSEDENYRVKNELKIKSEVIDRKSSEIEDNKRRIEVLDSDIVKFENIFQDANMRLIKSVQDNQEKEFNIRDLETKVRELERELKDFDVQSAKIEMKMKQLEKDEFVKKRSMFEKPVDQVSRSCGKCETLEKKLKCLQAKFEASEEQLMKTVEEKEVLTDIKNALKSEIDESLEKNETLIAEYKVKETDIIRKETEISGLINKSTALEEEVPKLEIKLQTTKDDLRNSTAMSDEFERNLNVVKANLSKVDETVELLKKENDELKNENKLLENNSKDHDRLAQATDSTLSKCEAALLSFFSLEATKIDLDVTRNELKAAVDDLNSIKASKQDIEMKYDKLVEDYENVAIKISKEEARAEEGERIVTKLEKENEKLYIDWMEEKTKNQSVAQGLEDEVSQLMLL